MQARVNRDSPNKAVSGAGRIVHTHTLSYEDFALAPNVSIVNDAEVFKIPSHQERAVLNLLRDDLSVEVITPGAEVSGRSILSSSIQRETIEVVINGKPVVYESFREVFSNEEFINRFIDGSMAKDIQDEMLLRIQNSSAQASLAIKAYTVRTGSTFTRNPDFLFADRAEEFTCVSPWNSASQGGRCGTLIHTRVVVLAQHFLYPVGTIVSFVTADNQRIDRNVVALKNVSGDIAIALLNDDIPSSITPAKIPTQDQLDARMPSTSTAASSKEQGAILCVMAFNNPDECFPKRLLNNGGSNTTLSDGFVESPYSKATISGDSGSPYFLITKSEALLLGTFFTAGGGPSLPDNRDLVITRMQELFNENSVPLTAQLEEPNLSIYPEYGNL